MSENKLAVTKDQMSAITNVEYTGHDLNESMVYPSVLNVLQSDKQYDAFEDGDSITKAMYGKVFLRYDTNKVSELQDKITGTILRIERGYEVRDDSGKIVKSGGGFMNKDDKQQWFDDGFKVKNMVKILISTYSYKQTMEMMAELDRKTKAGETVTKRDYPFSIVVVKGSSFGDWFEAEDMMEQISHEVYDKPFSQVCVSAFTATISGNKFESDEFGTYYGIKVDITANVPSEASDFTGIVYEMKDFSMFSKVGEKIESEEDSKDLPFKDAEVVDVDDIDKIL